MKQSDRSFQDEILISISDLWTVCKKSKKKIILSAMIGMILGSLFILIGPVRYSASGTFKEGSNSLKSITSKLETLIGKAVDTKSTTGIMQSRTVTVPVVQELGLQAALLENVPRGIGKAIGQNFEILLAYFKYTYYRRPSGGIVSGKVVIPDQVVIPDADLGICCHHVQYEGEYFIPLQIEFLDEERYVLKEPPSTVLGTYRLDESVENDRFRFQIARLSSNPLTSRSYTLTLIPLQDAAESLIKDVQIKRDKENTNILKLTYSNSDRYLAVNVINQIMFHYKDYLKREHQRTVRTQLDYLELRQNQTTADLESIMASHAQYLKEHLGHGGFIELEKEIEFFARNQAKYNERLMEIALELKLLDNLEREDYFYHHSVSDRTGSYQILEELRNLRQQRDILSLAIKESSTETDEQQQVAFHRQMARLNQIDKDLQEIGGLLEALQTGDLLSEHSLQYQPHSLINVWLVKLQDAEKAMRDSKTQADSVVKLNSLKQHQEWFSAFLKNIQQQLHVEAKMIREHIARQEGSETHFQGIDLATATKLYLNYNEKQDDIQAQIRQLDFVIKQMESPSFEISTLATILEDDVSKGIITDASNTLRQLKDEKNRSLKEQERLRSELNLSRLVLSIHVGQSRDLLVLRENLLKEKIYSLQKVTMDLIHQKISILDDQLDQHTRLNRRTLEQERELVKKELFNLNRNISHLPEKWLAEKNIELRTEMSLKMVEELAALVEAKNIAHDMEQIECMPLDLAVAPVLPVAPRLLFFAFLGAFAGTFICTGWLFCRTIFKGVSASSNNLVLSGQHVSGTLEETDALNMTIPTEENLSTMRRVISFLGLHEDGAGKIVTLFQGAGPDYSVALCYLLAKRGDKVLSIECNFEGSNSSSKDPGILQYLDGDAAAPVIDSRDGYDVIYAGGRSNYGIELMTSKRFQEYLSIAKNKYDWVILPTAYHACNAAAQSLFHISDKVIVTLSDERLDELKPLFSFFEDKENKKISFLFFK